MCPTAVSEAGCGNFAFHLALFGGFNYVSREVDAYPDAPFSYYNIPKDESEDPFIGQFKAVSAQLAETMKTYDVDSVWSDRAGNSSMYIGRHMDDVNAFTLRLPIKLSNGIRIR